MPRKRRDVHRGSSHVSVDNIHNKVAVKSTSGCTGPAGKICKKGNRRAVDVSVSTSKKKASEIKHDHEKLFGIRPKIGRPKKETSAALAFLAQLNEEEDKKKTTEDRLFVANQNTYQVNIPALQEAGREIAKDIGRSKAAQPICQEKQSPLNDPSVREVLRLCVKYTFEENYQSAESLQKYWRESLLQLLDVESPSAKTDVDQLSFVICKFAPPMSELKALKPKSAMKRFYEVLEHQVDMENKVESGAGKELTVALNKIQCLKNEVASGDSSDEDSI
tara:strand:- start:11866 stop:12696 length:831 start_codon:yes stop_codon:yes gene_type:complete